LRKYSEHSIQMFWHWSCGETVHQDVSRSECGETAVRDGSAVESPAGFVASFLCAVREQILERPPLLLRRLPPSGVAGARTAVCSITDVAMRRDAAANATDGCASLCGAWPSAGANFAGVSSEPSIALAALRGPRLGLSSHRSGFAKTSKTGLSSLDC
jgi:hypothetical protein